MCIQTTPIIGSDGKPLTPDQERVFRLEAALKETKAELKKALSDIETINKKLQEIESDKKRGPRF